jgi:hypothetical protein
MVQNSQLVHARLVQPHDGGVSQLFEDLLRRALRINFLRIIELRQELGRVHCLDNILEHFARLLVWHLLSLQSLVQDVYHLTAHVQDDDRHGQ